MLPNCDTSMIVGNQQPTFIEDSKLRIYSKEMKHILRNMYHCDSIYRENNDCWRIQGWIYVSDLPEIIPDEMIVANCELAIRDEKLIIEIWSMAVKDELPF